MRTAEEAVLVAALEGDEEEVRRRLDEFLPGERKALAQAVELVTRELEWMEEQCPPTG